MIHIVHVSSSHQEDDVRIMRRQCATLAASGYQVTFVVVGAEDGDFRGVRVCGVPKSRGRFDRFVLGPWRALWAARRLRPDVLHLHDPELLPWVPILRVLGHKVVIDTHENLDGLLEGREWVPRSLRGILNLLVVGAEALAARTASAVVVAGEDLAERLAWASPALVRNFPADEDIPPAGRQGDPADGVLVFVGGISRIRAIRELVDSLPLIASHRPVRLRLIGRCQPPELLAELEAREGWRHVDYYGHRPRAEVATLMRDAAVGVALLSPRPNHYGVRANKLFEYMAVELAILAPDFPHWRAFCQRWGCGEVVDPTDPAAIASVLRQMLDDPATTRAQGRRGREAVLQEVNWRNDVPRLLSVYRAILPDRVHPGASANGTD